VVYAYVKVYGGFLLLGVSTCVFRDSQLTSGETRGNLELCEQKGVRVEGFI